eukprot:tig00000391_g24847.t1
MAGPAQRPEPAFACTGVVTARPSPRSLATAAAACPAPPTRTTHCRSSGRRSCFFGEAPAALASGSSAFFASGARLAAEAGSLALRFGQRRSFSVRCSAADAGAGEPAPKASKKEYWFSALNPLIYAAAVVPVLVGTAAARWDMAAAGTLAAFSWSQAALVMVGEIMLQAWLNTSNDVYDSQTGVDNEKHDSFVNLTGKPAAVQAAALACLAVGAACVGLADRRMPNRSLAKIAALGVVFGYLYQGPPFRFSYKGIGEPMTFFAFGPLATLAASTAQLGRFSATAAAASVLVGFMVTSIIFAHHFHQVKGDKAAGKMTPVVRLGLDKAGAVYGPTMVYPLFAAAAALVAGRLLPARVLLAVAGAAPYALKLVRGVQDFSAGRTTSKPVKKACLWHMIGGFLLALALWPWRFLPLPPSLL